MTATKLPDISEYYQGDLAMEEEVAWIKTSGYKRNLEFLLPLVKEFEVGSVIEYGCGSGLVAAGIPPEVEYLGVDRNETFLDLAMRRCPKRVFVQADVRTYDYEEGFDLSTCWAFLKHFSLDEWDAVLARVLAAGKFGCFNVQILNEDLDDGKDYHHVYVTENRLAAALAAAGHEELRRQSFYDGELEGHGTMREVAVWTRRIVAAPMMEAVAGDLG